MKTCNKMPSQTLINRKKYSVLCSLLRGSSVTANPEYLSPGGVEALNDLEQEGICFLDKTAVYKRKLMQAMPWVVTGW